MPVAPAEFFQRMLIDRKGSYCFGENGLLLVVLRGLSYRYALHLVVHPFPISTTYLRLEYILLQEESSFLTLPQVLTNRP